MDRETTIISKRNGEVKPRQDTDSFGSLPQRGEFRPSSRLWLPVAPRYRDLYDKVRTSLYGFKHPSQYANLVLKPIRKINTQLIIEEWENLQRIFVSLALKTTTQSIIVGKLTLMPARTRPGGPLGI